jgi:anti-anti-sigma factor
MRFACAPSPALEGTGRVARLEVRVSEAPEEVVVRIAGEATVQLADELPRVLLGLTACRPPLVTLVLDGLNSVSCLALAALVDFRRGVVRAGGRVRLAPALRGPVRESLERTGLLELFGWPEVGAAPPVHHTGPLSQHNNSQGEAMNHIPQVQDLERAHRVAWGQLAELEPRLAELLWQARAAGAGCCGWEDVERVFAPFLNAVAELVGLRGRHHNHPVLGSVGAYEVAYWRLREAVAGLLPRPVHAQSAPEATTGPRTHVGDDLAA